jgi:hypothetical protein
MRTLGLWIALAILPTVALAQESPAELLYSGTLTEAEQKLTKHLQEKPKDDAARMVLGTAQFLRTFEMVGAKLYEHGIRTEFGPLRVRGPFVGVFPKNPNPKETTYDDVRALLEMTLAQLARSEATLAKITDKDVRVPMQLAKVRLDPFGQGKSVSAVDLMRAMGAPEDDIQQAEKFAIGFDRGDVCWLRGYMHLLSAMGELLLSVDGQEAFDHCGPMFFTNAKTPYAFIKEDWDWLAEQEGFGIFNNWRRQAGIGSDIFAIPVTTLRIPVRDRDRPAKAHAHIMEALTLAKQMWSFYKAETDDDLEWIPNPNQTGVLGLPVTEEMVTTWLSTLDETEAVLSGRSLIPFWRGNNPTQGINLKRVFTEPGEEFWLVGWIQGTEAVPYLEDGEVTQFAGRDLPGSIMQSFGPMRFAGYAFWFN